MFQDFTLLLVDLGLDRLHLLGGLGTGWLGGFLLNLGNHALPLHLNLLELAVKLVNLRLGLLLCFFFPVGGYDCLDGYPTLQE